MATRASTVWRLGMAWRPPQQSLSARTRAAGSNPRRGTGTPARRRVLYPDTAGGPPVTITLREGKSDDAERAGRICYEAFRAINEAHGFAPDIPSPEVGIAVLASMLRRPGFHVVVAEQRGEIVGSNCLDLRSEIAGVGPITVDPEAQNSGIGRLLMRHVIDRAADRPGIRLVQAAFHNRSLSLYTKLGFDPIEPLSCVQ